MADRNELLVRLLKEFDRLLKEPYVAFLLPFGEGGVRLVLTTPPHRGDTPETLANVTSRCVPPVLRDAANGLVGAAMSQYRRKERPCPSTPG